MFKAMRIGTLLATGLGAAAAGALGGLATRSSIGTWYPTLRKPRYVPPNVVFPIAWNVLYATIAGTSAQAIDRLRADGRDAEADAYVRSLAANYVLNGAWSWVFFKWHRLPAAAALAGVLALSSADLARRAASADPKLGAALAPYPAWTSFATVMSADIARLNRGGQH